MYDHSIQTLRNQTTRFLQISGPSGSGKSSAVYVWAPETCDRVAAVLMD